MKKILSLVLVTVMVMSLSIPVFADKPDWAGNNNGKKVEKELPKGLQDKAVIPYGHRKDQVVSLEDIEALIEEVEDYIKALDPDSDDDGIADVDEEEELSVDIIDLGEAEEIALDEKDGSIVKMSFDEDNYTFEIWFGDKLFKVEVDAISKDVDVEDKDDKYDLEGIMSYEDAKEVAIDIIADEEEIDSSDVDGIFIEVELDIEEDEEDESTYKVEFKTTTKTYEIEFNALNGDLIEFDSETNDEEYDWERDRDRDRDSDDESMVPAIYNLIDRIELELEKEEPKLGHFMFQLEQKFNTLQKIYGEAPEKQDYIGDLEELRDELEEIKNDSIFTEEEQEEIQVLINDIQDAIDDLADDEFISEDVYEDFEDDADEYFDMLDDKVESDEVEDLVTEIKDFALENDFGNDIGDYSKDEVMNLIMLAFEYSSIDKEDLEDYYKDLKFAYKKFKMSKLVAGDYLETLSEYKADLEALDDNELTEPEKTLKGDLIKLITRIENAGKMPLGIYYDIEEDALSLLGDTIEDPVDYEVALDELIDEVKEVIFTSYKGVNQNELRDKKMILLGFYLQGIEDQENAETEAEFEAAYNKLDVGLIAFNNFLEQ
ncbi:MAG: hypothetical protein U9N10_00430 [Bacillota bacterium]|nr:hypothetical protein [Bacillota bacterium]